MAIRKLIYAATILVSAGIGYVAGWMVNWWNSPLGEPLCVARGSEIGMRVLADLAADYRLFWLALFVAVGAVFAVPLYGVWYELKQHVR